MVTKTRIRQVIEVADMFDEETAAKMFDLKVETVKRYRALFNTLIPTPKTKVLVLDIETAPLRAYVWGVWKQNVGQNQIIDDWFMLSWSAKWLNSPDVFGDVLTSEEAIKQDDSRIAVSLHALIEEADVVIAHNGRKFDIPKINSRFLINKLPKPSPYRQIDTLEVSRKQFGFVKNNLDYLCQLVGVESKMSTGGFELWEQCYAGNKEALNKMLSYNIQDVVILEEYYHEIKGWIPNHPRMYQDTDGQTCEVCGGQHLKRNGTYSTNVNNYTSYSCMDCGSSLRKRNKSSDELVVNAR